MKVITLLEGSLEPQNTFLVCKSPRHKFKLSLQLSLYETSEGTSNCVPMDLETYDSLDEASHSTQCQVYRFNQKYLGIYQSIGLRGMTYEISVFHCPQNFYPHSPAPTPALPLRNNSRQSKCGVPFSNIFYFTRSTFICIFIKMFMVSLHERDSPT